MSRPSFKPTDAQRKLVRSMAAIGLRQEHICQVLQIRSPKTLRKHFSTELTAGHADAMGTVTRTAFDMATSGRFPAMTMFWLKTHAGWSEEMEVESTFDERKHGPGSELIFATRNPNAPDGFEKIGTDGALNLYQRSSEIRRRRSRPAGSKGELFATEQEEFHDGE